jgi:hypothetical protein
LYVCAFPRQNYRFFFVHATPCPLFSQNASQNVTQKACSLPFDTASDADRTNAIEAGAGSLSIPRPPNYNAIKEVFYFV